VVVVALHISNSILGEAGGICFGYMALATMHTWLPRNYFDTSLQFTYIFSLYSQGTSKTMAESDSMITFGAI